MCVGRTIFLTTSQNFNKNTKSKNCKTVYGVLCVKMIKVSLFVLFIGKIVCSATNFRFYYHQTHTNINIHKFHICFDFGNYFCVCNKKSTMHKHYLFFPLKWNYIPHLTVYFYMASNQTIPHTRPKIIV